MTLTKKIKQESNFEVGDQVIISKYRIFLQKCYFPNWSEEVFMIKNVKNTVLDTDML